MEWKTFTIREAIEYLKLKNINFDGLTNKEIIHKVEQLYN